MRSTTQRVALAALALVLLPGAARGAETLGVLAVEPPPGPSPELVDLTSQLRGVLAQSTPGVLEAGDLRQRMTGQTSTASLTELERASSGAIAAYQAGDYEGAITTLRAVLEDVEKLPDGPEPFRLWSKTMLRLARYEQTVGRRAEGQAVLERLVRADPAVKVDPTQYPPSFAKQVEEVRTDLSHQKSRKLTVISAQKGARVYVDGRDVGLAPVVVSVAPGKYRVSGALQELRAPPVKVDLAEEDQTVSVDFSLVEALRPSAGPGLALGPADRMRRIVMASATLGLDRVVATSLVQDGDVTFLQGTMIDVRRGSVQREGRLRLAGKVAPPGGVTALTQFLMTGQPSQLVRPAPAAPPAPIAAAPAGGSPAATAPQPEIAKAEPDLSVAPPPDRPPIRPEAPAKAQGSTLLKWSPVATLAVGIGAGAYAYARATTAQRNYNAAKEMLVGGTVRPGLSPTVYNDYVSKGDSSRRAATIAGAGAGVALVATGVLGYLSHRQSGEVGPFRF